MIVHELPARFGIGILIGSQAARIVRGISTSQSGEAEKLFGTAQRKARAPTSWKALM